MTCIQWTALILILGLMMMSQFTMARDICTEPERRASLDANSPNLAPNLVMEPKYSMVKAKNNSDLEQTPAKLQYEPLDFKVPLLEERTAPVERNSGAEYTDGNEMHIAPKSEHVIKDEEIQEKDGVPAKNSVSPH